MCMYVHICTEVPLFPILLPESLFKRRLRQEVFTTQSACEPPSSFPKHSLTAIHHKFQEMEMSHRIAAQYGQRETAFLGNGVDLGQKGFHLPCTMVSSAQYQGFICPAE